VLDNRPQCYAVVDDSFTMAPSPMSNIYKVFDNLQILWIAHGGCIVTMISPLTLAKLLEFYQDLWMLLGNNNKSQHVFSVWGSTPIYWHINFLCVWQPSNGVDVHMDASLPWYCLSHWPSSLGSLLRIPIMPGNQPQHYAVVEVEALHSSIMTPNSKSNIHKGFENLHYAVDVPYGCVLTMMLLLIDHKRDILRIFWCPILYIFKEIMVNDT
jgi:hypothetical protein